MTMLHTLEGVHVWVAPLSADPEHVAALHELLSPDERQRAARFVADDRREEFVVARGTLRRLLALYLGADPAALAFVSDGNGKPALSGRELFFNVSHSHGLAVYALTRLGEVGIDVEQVRPRASLLDMADRFFAPAEAAAIRRLPPERREEAFFHVWTRKEAFIKATAQGLSYGLDRFEVSVPPDDPARIRLIEGDPETAAAWSMVSLLPAEGYVAALALAGAMPSVEVRTWRHSAEGAGGGA
jgi:4'-phosphopantetheinyl transferase